MFPIIPSISNKTRQTNLDSIIPLTVPDNPTTSQLPTPIKKVNINAQIKVEFTAGYTKTRSLPPKMYDAVVIESPMEEWIER